MEFFVQHEETVARSLEPVDKILAAALKEAVSVEIKGRVTQVLGTIIKAVLPSVRIGEICLLRNPFEDRSLQAEVVGFSKQAALLTPLGEIGGISSSTEVIPSGKYHTVPVGPSLLGRVLDGLGNPMDTGRLGPVEAQDHYPVYAEPPAPLTRRFITKPMPLGLRVIDGLLTCGEGQRMGIFSAAGVGKSRLLAILTKGAEADVKVLALIGERGREVREFLEKDLGNEGMRRAVAVVSTSDRPAMERLKAAYVATTIAEYFRDQGKSVLLLMDSVTRFARALREIGLAAGEPPTRRGFPPSVFSTLPRLIERAGQSDKGSITGLYTILVEADDMNEPVADEMRAILDGHIVLSRKLASAGHYPAVDVPGSLSRVMSSIVDANHRAAAARLRELLAKYQEIELLVRIGEYKEGSDPEADTAIHKIEAINHFLRQDSSERISFEDTATRLKEIAFQ